MAYLTVKSVEEVLDLINSFKKDQANEAVGIMDSLGRTLGEDILAPLSLPPYNRSAVDGFCVNWEDVSGASETLPVFLKVVDNIEMGQAPSKILSSNETMAIATGGMLPSGADAVVMVEYTERLTDDEVAIYDSVASFENVLKEGEDIKQGEVVLTKGVRITPENISLLSALGIKEVKVTKKKVVGILSTGDELIELGMPLKDGYIYNSNGPGLITAVLENGGIPKYYGIIKDEFDTLKNSLQEAVSQCDIVILTGGTSVGVKDFVEKAINSIGAPGVLVHGIAMKPGKPTIIGQVGSVPVFGLSGNPVSAMLGFRLFIQPLLNPKKGETIVAKVARNIPSAGGREDYIPVKLSTNEGQLMASPIFSKSNSIGSLTKMDGLLIMEKDCEGLVVGSEGKVILKEGFDIGLLK